MAGAMARTWAIRNTKKANGKKILVHGKGNWEKVQVTEGPFAERNFEI